MDSETIPNSLIYPALFRGEPARDVMRAPRAKVVRHRAHRQPRRLGAFTFDRQRNTRATTGLSIPRERDPDIMRMTSPSTTLASQLGDKPLESDNIQKAAI